MNTPTRIVVLEEQHDAIDQLGPHLKCSGLIRSNDIAPRKRRGRNQEVTFLELESVVFAKERTLEEVQTHKKVNDIGNMKISIHYCNDLLDQNNTIINDMFAFSIAHEILHNDYEPRSIIECRQRQDWPK